VNLPIASEFELIRRIRSLPSRVPPGLELGIGDDCAVLDPAHLGRLVITSDLLVENVDFKSEWISPWLLGRKALRVNLSDLAAMGARPYACLFDVGFPPSWGGAWFERLLSSFVEEANHTGMPLIGGDLSKSERLTLSVTALGRIESGRPLLRSGARVGDCILLLGPIGLSRAGLELLFSRGNLRLESVAGEADLLEQVDEDYERIWLKNHFLPEIFAEPAAWIREHDLAGAMIDISDGLGADLGHILEASQVAAEIETECLPRVPGVTDRARELDLVLNGGEDFSLLFTARPEQWRMLESTYPPDWVRPVHIGNVVPGDGTITLSEEGRRSAFRPKGYDHFQCGT